jgi:hypothetical protein
VPLRFPFTPALKISRHGSREAGRLNPGLKPRRKPGLGTNPCRPESGIGRSLGSPASPCPGRGEPGTAHALVLEAVNDGKAIGVVHCLALWLSLHSRNAVLFKIAFLGQAHKMLGSRF